MNKLNVFSKSPKFSNERTFLENKKLLEKKGDTHCFSKEE
jgi:hypothetical protein